MELRKRRKEQRKRRQEQRRRRKKQRRFDLVVAAEAQAEAAKLENRWSVLSSSGTAAGPAKWTRSELIVDQIRSKTKIMSEVPSKNDFVGDATALGAELTKPASLLEQELNAKKNMMIELASKNDFAGAAAAQMAAKKIETLMEQKMMFELVSKIDFKGAAAAQGGVKEIETFAGELRAKDSMMNELAPRGNYVEAAAALKEKKATGQQIKENFAPKMHEEQLAAKKQTLQELVDKNDFKGAAAAHAEVLELEKRLPVLATGPEEQIRSKGNFTGAAAAKAEVDDLKKRVKKMSVTSLRLPVTSNDSGKE